MKRFTISLAVALFVGLVVPQATTGTQNEAAPSTVVGGFDYSAQAKNWMGTHTKMQDQYMKQAQSMGTDYSAGFDVSQYAAQS